MAIHTSINTPEVSRGRHITHNPCFKPPAANILYISRRTPSPPRAFIEPLSPLGLPRQHWFSSTAHSAWKKELPYDHLRTLQNGDIKTSRHRASSSIDALADAALAASPSYPSPKRKSLESRNGHHSPDSHTQSLGGRDFSGEPPHKRARSENILASPTHTPFPRPMTSYENVNGHLSALTNTPSQTRFEDAELLLNLHTGGWHVTTASPSLLLQSNQPPTPQTFPLQPSHHLSALSHSQSFGHNPSMPATSAVETAPEVSSIPTLVADPLPEASQPRLPKQEIAPPHILPYDKTAEQRATFSPGFSDISSYATHTTTDESQPKAKGRRGWPKGKPRLTGPRKEAQEKAVKKRAPKKATEPTKPKKLSKRQAAKELAKAGAQAVRIRRHSFDNRPLDRPWTTLVKKRSQSVPTAVPLIIHPSKTNAKIGRRRLAQLFETVCSTCMTSRESKTSSTELDDWISCNGCKLWFHIDCAGFKKAAEVRDVDKYFCRSCVPAHGPTTYVRKSSRAHAAVDYAELQKGVLKMNEDNVEHHYIQPIKDGTFQFDPETFPRVRPESVNREFFEKSEVFVEPICIPAEWNPRPWTIPENASNQPKNAALDRLDGRGPLDKLLPEDLGYNLVSDEGQDRLGMVMPQDLTVRQVCDLVGADTPLDVIDVKSQNSGGAKWNLGRWADYYEEESEEKTIRNVISLEVSQSKLGRILKRPQIVRDIDLQDDVWPQEEIGRGRWPKVQFYCLMSVADSYTDFHIDFGGSSVYYHILRGKKTFFFIPPKPKYLKAYEEWNDSPQQNYTFLPNITKECYRIDLHEGDTMLIPSGWIHAVWTPATSLVIGGNFLTRLSYRNQFRVVEIEKNNETPMKFRYPHFQKIMWYTVIKYLKDDPLPDAVRDMFYAGQQFKRETPIWSNPEEVVTENEPRPGAADARYYPRVEIDGLPDLVNYIFRTVMVVMGRVEGATADRIRRVNASIPKGYGEPLEIAKTFALWVAWKRGNEDPPAWVHPSAVLPNSKDEGAPKKLSARALKEMERKEAIAAWRVAPDRQSARVMSRNVMAHANNGHDSIRKELSKIEGAVDATVPTIVDVKPHDHPIVLVPSNPHHDTPLAQPVAQQCDIKMENQPDALNETVIQPSLTPVKEPVQPEAITNSSMPIDAVSSVMSGQHISTPKTSVLGPKRVACDVCRKRRIRCKHKDLVQQIEPNGPGAPQFDPMLETPMLSMDSFDAVHLSPSVNHSRVDIKQSSEEDGETPDELAGFDEQHLQSHSPSQLRSHPHAHPHLSSNDYLHARPPVAMNGVVSFGGGGDLLSKKGGRTKACLECRKSKRRCAHDDKKNIDLAAASESHDPRDLVRGREQENIHPGSKFAVGAVNNLPVSAASLVEYQYPTLENPATNGRLSTATSLSRQNFRAQMQQNDLDGGRAFENGQIHAPIKMDHDSPETRLPDNSSQSVSRHQCHSVPLLPQVSNDASQTVPSMHASTREPTSISSSTSIDELSRANEDGPVSTSTHSVDEVVSIPNESVLFPSLSQTGKINFEKSPAKPFLGLGQKDLKELQDSICRGRKLDGAMLRDAVVASDQKNVSSSTPPLVSKKNKASVRILPVDSKLQPGAVNDDDLQGKARKMTERQIVHDRSTGENGVTGGHNEDEKLARALQQESLGLRRRGRS